MYPNKLFNYYFFKCVNKQCLSHDVIIFLTENVAAGRGRYATQTGIDSADKALDGNSGLSAVHCATAHDPGLQDKVWWMVDLGGQYAIYNVIIYSGDQGKETTLKYAIMITRNPVIDMSSNTVASASKISLPKPQLFTCML